MLRWSLNASEGNTSLKLGPWIMWRLWKSRNDFYYRGEDYEPSSVITKVQEDLDEWNSRDELEEKEVTTVPEMQGKERWTPPPHDWLKCNSDGAWDKTKEHSGVGWVLRNHLGDVVWMGGRKLPRGRSPIKTEAESLRWAISTMVRLNYNTIIFETDCRELVQALQERDSRPSIHSFVQDMHHQLAKLGEVQVAIRGRKSNTVADRIAKEALSFENNAPVLFSIIAFFYFTISDLIKSLIMSYHNMSPLETTIKLFHIILLQCFNARIHIIHENIYI